VLDFSAKSGGAPRYQFPNGQQTHVYIQYIYICIYIYNIIYIYMYTLISIYHDWCDCWFQTFFWYSTRKKLLCMSVGSPNALLAFQMNRLAQGARDSSESINHFFYPHWITFANSSGGELLVAIDPNFST
jgi:hypothetical protein